MSLPIKKSSNESFGAEAKLLLSVLDGLDAFLDWIPDAHKPDPNSQPFRDAAAMFDYRTAHFFAPADPQERKAYFAAFYPRLDQA